MKESPTKFLSAHPVSSDQNQVLELLATGQSLADILDALLVSLEKQIPGTRGSILLLDEAGLYLNLGAGLGLPEPYRAALQNIPIGPHSGICGIAAYSNETVLCPDIANDSNCASFKELAFSQGLLAAWSIPIRNTAGKVLGTLCPYLNETRLPGETELELTHQAAYLAGIAIQFKRSEAQNRHTEQKLHHAQEEAARFGRILDNSSNEIYAFNIDTLRFMQVNHGACENLGYTMNELSAMTPLDIKPDLDLPQFEKLIRPLIEKKQSRITFQTRHLRKSGTLYPVEVHLQLMHEEQPPVFLAVIEDITQRKQIEQKLSFIEHCVEYAGDGAFFLELSNGTFEYVNASACESLGYTREELLQMTVFDIDPDFSKEGFDEFMEAFRKNKKAVLETRHRRKDGKIFPVEIHTHYIVFDGKEYSIAFSRDISDRKHSELLVQSHNQILEMLGTGKDLQAILDALNQFAEALCADLVSAILLLDTDTHTMHYASAPNLPRGYVEALNGFAIGPDIPSCGSTVYNNQVVIREDIEKDPLWKPYLPIAREHGIQSCWSIPIRNSAGEALGSFSFLPRKKRKPSDKEIEIINTLAHLAGIAVERKRVERQLQFIHYGISRAGDQAFWVDWETARFVYVNATTCESLGYSEQELLTMTPFDIDIEAKQENWPLHQEEMVREKTVTFESVQKRKDGSTFPVELTSHLVEYEGKRYIITFGRDITDRKKNEAEIIRARDAAEQANQAKSHFLSRMSHELRTPMNAILGFSQIMKLDPENQLSDSYQENIQHILKAGQHLKLLIDEVLDLSMVESGHVELALQDIPVGPVIREIITQMEPLRKAYGVRIINENLTVSEHVIYADLMRFKQILINLFSNGIKYNRRDGTLSISVKDHPDRSVSIQIRDTGEGIPEEQLDDLFEPFNRLNFEYGEVEGTGIGLNITQELVRRMEGTIKVESTMSQGSVFTVTFPGGKPSGAAELTGDFSVNEKAKEESTAENKPSPRRTEIFYIEDHPTNLQLVKNIIGLALGTTTISAGE